MNPTVATLEQDVKIEDRPERPITRIGRRSSRVLVDVRELWAARELLVQLARRDLSVRFKQTIFGIAWAVVPALATMVVFAVFLGRLGNLSQGNEQYPLFVFAGTLPWAFFSAAVAAAGNSLINNQGLITKIYFPRLVLPLAAFGTPLVDLLIGCGLLAGFALYFQIVPSWNLLLLPAVVALLFVSAAGVGILLSALIVAQRDFRFLLGLGLQLWLFATPSIYLPTESYSQQAKVLLSLNPAYGPILAFRQCVLGGPIDGASLATSALVGCVLLFLGLRYFRKTERTFADAI